MSRSLYHRIRADVTAWRGGGYVTEFPEIAQVLNYQYVDETKQTLRYLRRAQFEALETYLFLRFVKHNKKVIELYQDYFTGVELVKTLIDKSSVPDEINEIIYSGGIDALIGKITADNDFVKRHKLTTAQESLSLAYPSYIFSLVMGAGKTILIGTIIFIEFALALKTKSDKFLKNALVFAPGLVIIGSLKEISQLELQKILPAALAQQLAVNLKLTWTTREQKTLSVIDKSNYNLIITNIEKIRITSRARVGLFKNQTKINSAEKENIVNLRLQQIASLSNLGVFSDEAHKTYGKYQTYERDLGAGIKKVRETINYLAAKTTLQVVVNTTGTPYYKRQILKDVVHWYGLLEGIEDNILKDVRDNSIQSYSEMKGEDCLRKVLDDFFENYGDLALEGGYKAKLAIYFPQIEDVKKLRPFIEKYLTQYGLSPQNIFEVNSKSSAKDKDIFINRVNERHLPYRVFLLVQMGTEGWNCPSLFACCLVNDFTSSGNFVLQAAMRCLRQLPNNNKNARIYLSKGNDKILNRELQANYGEDLYSLQQAKNSHQEVTITLRNEEVPSIKTTRTIKKYTRKEQSLAAIKLSKPEPPEQLSHELSKISIRKTAQGKINFSEAEITEIKLQQKKELSIYSASLELASLYALKYFEIFAKLQEFYPHGRLTAAELRAMKCDIESQLDSYDLEEGELEEELEIIKKTGFKQEQDATGNKIYTATITIAKEKLDKLLRDYAEVDYTAAAKQLSFHYSPYKSDSELEVSLFDYVLRAINEKAENIKHFLFVGGITDPNKTDLIFEYKDKDGKLRNYTPDFVLIKQDESVIFMETKGRHLVEDFKQKEKYFRESLGNDLQVFSSDTAAINNADKTLIRGLLSAK